MPEPIPHILFSAGDASGDRHAAALAQELRAKIPRLRISALGGPALKKISNYFLYDLVALGGFGFWEPLLKLPALFRAKKSATETFQKDPPQLVVLVDYYGFNIHLARSAKRLNIPVVSYISPQVWASRPHRVLDMKPVLRRMMVLFPFEKLIYEKAGIPVTGVRHPLLDRLPRPIEKTPDTVTIGLFPGSRPSVIRRHLPILAETVQQLQKGHPSAQFILVRSSDADLQLFQEFSQRCPEIKVVSDENYEIRKTLTVALSVSGTTSLELALLGIPMVLYYKLSALTYAIAKCLVKIPYVGIPNILAGRVIIPEIIQSECTPNNLSSEIIQLLNDSSARLKMRESLLALRRQLEENGISAADVVYSELSSSTVSP